MLCQPTSTVYAAGSSAALLQSFQSLPSRVTRSSAAAVAYPPTQSRLIPNPTPSRSTPSYPTSQPSRPQGVASSSTHSSARLDKLYAAYMDNPKAKASTSSRSISVGRRSSSDIAASLNRPLDRSLGSGIGSLGARQQPLQGTGSASIGRRAIEQALPASTAYSRNGLRATAYQPQQLQHDGTPATLEGSSRLARTLSTSSNSVSGRSSLIDRSSSPSFQDEDPLTNTRAGGNLPSAAESVPEHSSRALALSRYHPPLHTYVMVTKL